MHHMQAASMQNPQSGMQYHTQLQVEQHVVPCTGRASHWHSRQLASALVRTSPAASFSPYLLQVLRYQSRRDLNKQLTISLRSVWQLAFATAVDIPSYASVTNICNLHQHCAHAQPSQCQMMVHGHCMHLLLVNLGMLHRGSPYDQCCITASYGAVWRAVSTTAQVQTRDDV